LLLAFCRAYFFTVMKLFYCACREEAVNEDIYDDVAENHYEIIPRHVRFYWEILLFRYLQYNYITN